MPTSSRIEKQRARRKSRKAKGRQKRTVTPEEILASIDGVWAIDPHYLSSLLQFAAIGAIKV